MDGARYEVLDVIGSGGMAMVWRARDTMLGRLVAIKRPNPAADDSRVTARFAREACAAASVSHPNLVVVYDAGVDGTGPYLVMELVDGPSLATGGVAVARVGAIGVEVASALAALHAAGIVHGDVKPGNILLAPSGAKLTDFGIARAVDDTATLTQPGVAFGTPAFAAPETAAHGERGPAADVYSLAATLHELLTGSRWNTMIGSTQVMPPGPWAHVLAPALSTQPADRPTAAEFAASLATVGGLDPRIAPTVPMGAGVPVLGGRVDAPAQEAPTSRRVAIGGALVAAVLLIALITALAWRDRDDGTGAEPGAATVASSAPAPTLPATSTQAATAAPTTSPAPTAPAPTTPAPTTPAPTVPPAATGASALAAELIAHIEAVPASALKPNKADDIVTRIEDVVRAATEAPDEVDRTLRSAADQIAKNLREDAARARAEELLVAMADTLGVPASTVTDVFERGE